MSTTFSPAKASLIAAAEDVVTAGYEPTLIVGEHKFTVSKISFNDDEYPGVMLCEMGDRVLILDPEALIGVVDSSKEQPFGVL